MSEGRKPDYVVRIKQEPDSEFWFTAGAAWRWKEGKDGLAVRIHNIPVAWDGSFILVPPLETEEEPPKKGKK